MNGHIHILVVFTRDQSRLAQIFSSDSGPKRSVSSNLAAGIAEFGPIKSKDDYSSIQIRLVSAITDVVISIKAHFSHTNTEGHLINEETTAETVSCKCNTHILHLHKHFFPSIPLFGGGQTAFHALLQLCEAEDGSYGRAPETIICPLRRGFPNQKGR